MSADAFSDIRDQLGGQAVVVCLSTIKPERLEWLWPARIPCGKLTLLVGQPGLGKSFATLDLAARLSTGTPLPGESERPQKSATLLLAVEDDLGDTIRPRLDALGADVSLIHALRGIKDAAGERLPNLGKDLTAVREAIERTKAKLVVVDPINAYLPGIDGNDDIKLRTVLTPPHLHAASCDVA